MLIIRCGQIVASAAGAVLAVVGVLVFPTTVAVLWTVGALLVGPGATVCVHRHLTGANGAHPAQPGARPGLIREAAVLVGVTAAVATTAVTAVSAGLAALLGPVAALVIPVLLGAAAGWGWWRRGTWQSWLARLVAPEAGAGTDPDTTSHNATSRNATSRSGHARRVDPHADKTGAGAGIGRLGSIVAREMCTAQLCGLWQHTYWVLVSLPPGPQRGEVVAVRQAVLDELDRRDPAGVRRWLQTHPRAGSDPSRYLTADH